MNKSSKKVLGAVLLVAGAVLLYFGYNASQAPIEQIGEALTGRFSDETMLYLLGGAISAIAGLVMLLRR